MQFNTRFQEDARKAADGVTAAICHVNDPGTALDAVNKTDDFIRTYPQHIQVATVLTMSSLEALVTEKAITHIENFGTDNQCKAAAELHDKPEPAVPSPEYLKNGDKIATVQDALVNLLGETKSTDDYIARKPAIEALIGCAPLGRDELCGLSATRLRSLLISEATDDMVQTNQISFGDLWRYNLLTAYNALGCESKLFALAFLDCDNLGPRFYHPAALSVNSAPTYYLMAASRIALLSKFHGYEDITRMVQALYVAAAFLLDIKGDDIGDGRVSRLYDAMDETFKTGSLSYWEHPSQINNDED